MSKWLNAGSVMKTTAWLCHLMTDNTDENKKITFWARKQRESGRVRFAPLYQLSQVKNDEGATQKLPQLPSDRSKDLLLAPSSHLKAIEYRKSDI